MPKTKVPSQTIPWNCPIKASGRGSVFAFAICSWTKTFLFSCFRPKVIITVLEKQDTLLPS